MQGSHLRTARRPSVTRAEPTSPQRGDIIVERRHASAVRYVVRLFNGTPQLLYQDREEAIRSATGFAAAQGVGAWYTDDGKAYRRIVERNR
jgi:hypothetical protein